MKNTTLVLFGFLSLLLQTTQAQKVNRKQNMASPQIGIFSNCHLETLFLKTLCSDIENNKPQLIRNQLQLKSGQNAMPKVMKWTKENYYCIRCRPEPGFGGGQLLRKCVVENAREVAAFLIQEASVDMNFIEQDGLTLLDWLQEETERTFDEAFETENSADKKWLMLGIQNNLQFYNTFKNAGAKFSSEL
ncbi:MAG: hypothetical protein K1X82_05875 [Bacteroidia bacterium]|nr:hypothetical protein [Bacteroidia bacterium]